MNPMVNKRIEVAMPRPDRRRRRFGPVAVLALISALGGCADALPSFKMPDLVQDTRKLLTKEEQQQAINDLSAKKDAQQADAARQPPPSTTGTTRPADKSE
jgi:hypothetical protein